GLRTGIETNFRQQLNGESYSFITEAWAGFAIGDQLSVNIDLAAEKRESSASNTRVTLGLRSYF
ncbi:MAG: hypothetical protein ACI9JP_002236, partial [Granulosicoccus sp.]